MCQSLCGLIDPVRTCLQRVDNSWQQEPQSYSKNPEVNLVIGVQKCNGAVVQWPGRLSAQPARNEALTRDRAKGGSATSPGVAMAVILNESAIIVGLQLGMRV
jgi:hypothetical protein